MNKWHGWRPVSLRSKLIVAVACCLLLTIGAGSLLSSWLTKDMMKETVIQNAGNSLDAANLYLTDQINRLIYISNYLYLDNELNLSLKYRQSGVYVGQTEVSDVMRKLDNLSYAGEPVYISVWTGDGKMIYSNFQSDQYRIDGLNMSSIVHSEQFAAGGRLNFWLHPAYISQQGADARQHPYMLSVARSLRILSGKPYGYVVISMDEQRLKEVLSKYSSTIQMMVVGSDNRIISHNDDGMIGKDFDTVKNGRSDLVEVERDMSVSGWRLEGLVPYGAAAQKINRIYQVTNLVQAVVVLLFLLLLMLGIARLTQPIARLVKVVRKIDNEHLHLRSGIRGEDEAGLLGQSLDDMLDRVENMITQVEREQSERRRAELDMLQAQINPHFLFNILGAIRMDLLLKGSEEAAELLGSLSSLLRMTINRGNEMIPVREEMETVRHYVRLIDFQRDTRVRLEMDVQPESLEVMLPRFIIQPLVENAYQHGLSRYGGILWIQSWVAGQFLHIEVRDSGEGMDEKRLQAVRAKLALLGEPADTDVFDDSDLFAPTDYTLQSEVEAMTSQEEGAAFEQHLNQTSPHNRTGISGIGLTNVVRRLYMIYGNQVQIQVDSHPGEGTGIVLGIPLHSSGNGIHTTTQADMDSESSIATDTDAETALSNDKEEKQDV
ncbi:sensor histidine kinase [Paenibacillus sp. WLX1005]|uniref:sensor histidine kinase n=1 Tax=Paenibacillus sp. WLX1005 TaxID=3243766 RepID=UPI0039845CAC